MEAKKAMLSQPMAGKTEAEIIATREKAIAALQAKGYEIVNTLFTDEWYSMDKMTERGVVQIPLCFMARGMENMSKCHAVYFCKGWTKARGCRVEHAAAKAYGLEIIYEDETETLAMGEQEFTYEAKRAVAKYVNEHLGKTDNVKPLTAGDIYMVWGVKVLQNNKGLFATPLSDAMYYEVTFNGDKSELYLDAYKKFENRCVLVV